ncbi:TetR/AcrR family transcriptional regulator [Streptomyces cadmiisoli]|uniref:TetR/AcrR family transcriptional regulator n=1 Tax=Streptomyces cadmiisoli TaxID=2184053 RepID=A0A2Z4JB93_9ACTN|nr:TetR/AcrR family transcriptional regulator [Streptomyces cadmiisoli]AWW41633.1 TetR/AcrR family transcriptional regulator [Streptomyces cadmiisoli]
MSNETSPVRRRRGRGARERILQAATELFTAQGVNATGMEQLTTAAHVSKRTLYTHFASKDDLVHAYLTQLRDGRLPPQACQSEPCPDPRGQLLAIFDWEPPTTDGPLRGCPFLNAAVEVPDPDHPVHQLAAAYKIEFAQRLTDLARQAGACDPEELGEQLALLYDGAACRTMALNSARAGAHARTIAAKLINEAIPCPSTPPTGASTTA